MWPGDALELTANGSTVSVIVRQVEVVDQAALRLKPWLYRMAFANDWAEELGLKLSADLSQTDALVPADGCG